MLRAARKDEEWIVYLCICNALTDRKLKEVIAGGQATNAADVYQACGCRAQCGECVKAIKSMLLDIAPGCAVPAG